MLILAGVSINLVLGNNGIIAKAKEAQKKSAEASQNDLKGMNGLVSEMEGALIGNSGKTEPETEPYLPRDFHYDTSTSIDTGLVIADSNGNEYVWVVVPRTTAVYATTGLGKTTFTDADYTSIEKDLKEYTKTYRGSTSYSDTYAADTDNVGWLTSDEYTELKNSMLKSVYENGGFYVGRYEAGIGTNRTSNTDTNSDGKYTMPSTAPVSQADAYPYTYVTRTQAQNLASKVNSGTKTSSLMFGVQWDLMLAFMSKDTAKITSTDTLTKNSTTIGNYLNSTFDLNRGKYAKGDKLENQWNNFDKALGSIVVSNETTGKMKKTEQSSYFNGILLTTGGTEQSKIMNIYDVAGNVFEWTLENTSYASDPCVKRGGNYCLNNGSIYPAASRNADSTTLASDYVGFRLSLW